MIRRWLHQRIDGEADFFAGVQARCVSKAQVAQRKLGIDAPIGVVIDAAIHHARVELGDIRRQPRQKSQQTAVGHAHADIVAALGGGRGGTQGQLPAFVLGGFEREIQHTFVSEVTERQRNFFCQRQFAVAASHTVTLEAQQLAIEANIFP